MLRKIKDALEYLNLDSNPILNHRNKRVVYGVALSENFDKYLMNLTKTVKYIIPQTKAKYRSDLISEYWIKRWLCNRIKNIEVLEKVKSHSLSYPITHGARVELYKEEEMSLSNS